MREGRGSRTAERVAERRAAHQLLDSPLVFEDPLALSVIPPEVASSLLDNPQQYDRSIPGRYLRAFLVVRSRVAEDSLREAVKRGVQQYVVLGAGFDTFAFRNPHPARTLRIFEVDHPDTQAIKLSRLKDAGIQPGSDVTFIPVDLSKEPLQSALLQHGFDESSPSFFSWLGVVLYLEVEDIRRIWRYVGSLAGGTTMVFDYAVNPSSLSFPARLTLKFMAARVASIGEPWKTYFDPGAIDSELRAAGFASVQDLGQAELNHRFFSGRSDGFRVGEGGRIIVASAGPGGRRT
ncbi:MAG: class I SAM-dependent methyltransferase [Acidobacteriota bacterium]